MSFSAPRHFRAPTEDGTALIDPPLSQVPELIATNRARLAEFDRVSGFPAGFRQSVRAGVSPDVPLILTGHQPELFHPGVWFKNFLASSIAQHVGGRAVNLVIDSDLVRSTSIRVPTGKDEPAVVEMPFDSPAAEMPWECRTVVDDETFKGFGRAVSSLVGTQISGQPIIDTFWPAVVALASDARREIAALARESKGKGIPFTSTEVAKLGEGFVTGRREVEIWGGIQLTDVFLSSDACKRAWLSFLLTVLSRFEELFAAYNGALDEYRLLGRVRSNMRPVPNLIKQDGWTEAPLWSIFVGAGTRRRVFLRRIAGGLEFTDFASPVQKISESAEPSHLWFLLVGGRYVLRPRALMTTMFARLILGDLFIHGIGGAKYDEVTDEIIRRFFGVEPPEYITATATFRLPIDRPQVTVEDVRDAAERIRDVRYRPERLLSEPAVKHDLHLHAELSALAAEKLQFVRTHALRRGSEATYKQLARINTAMQERLHDVERELRAEHAHLLRELKRSQLLGSREFSFVLYPEEYLVPRLLELSKIPA